MSRRLYEIVGLACGFILIDYGFNTIAIGLRGARVLTAQSVGISLLAAGSALIFGALYHLLRPAIPQAPLLSEAVSGIPDVGVELIVTEEKPTGPKYGFYKNIEYIGYFFTFLGIVSSADLVLQVFIPLLYNESRFWVELLLVVFGVLSYAIFFSIGRLASQEEKIIQPTVQPVPQAVVTEQSVTEQPAATEAPPAAPQAYSEVLEVHLDAFSKSESGEYERNLSEKVYDMIMIERHGVTIWREDRLGLRTVYLAGPYELNWRLMEDYVNGGVELRIGSLFLPLETMRELLSLRVRPGVGVPSPAASQSKVR